MKINIRASIFILTIITISFLSCKDDPISNQEDHFEAIGTIIYDATGDVAVSILRGVTTDTLKIKNGELSEHFTVKFYDDNENIVDPPDDEHTKLNYEIGDTTLAAWLHNPDSLSKFKFQLNGKKIGKTHLELFIMHEEHNDYRSEQIPLCIE